MIPPPPFVKWLKGPWAGTEEAGFFLSFSLIFLSTFFSFIYYLLFPSIKEIIFDIMEFSKNEFM